MTMNKTLLFSAFVGVAFGSVNCIAEPEIPDLVGHWESQTELAKILKKEVPTSTHHTEHTEFGNVTLEYQFTEQKGRLLKGIKTSPSSKANVGKTEKIVCAIGFDNESIHCTDEDAIEDGLITSNHEIHLFYHQIDEDQSTVALKKLTKKK